MHRIEDTDKPHRRRIITSLWAAVLLAIMLACLIRIDTVCKMQVDTLDQTADLRQEIGAVVIARMETTIDILPAVDLTAADYDLVCRVVAAEARGEGYDGQLAVAQCIRDRSILWGLTPVEVVTASGQFAAPYQGEIGADVQAAVNDCLVLGYSAFDGAVTHFHEDSVTPYWVADKVVIGVVGNHKFYR